LKHATNQFTKISSTFVLLVAALVLSRLLFDLDALNSLLAGLENMKFNTALCLFCSAVSLVLLDRPHTGRAGRITANSLSIVVLVISSLTLAQYIFSWETGIDNLFYHHPSAGTNNLHPGRMPVATAIFLCLFNLVLLLLAYRRTHFYLHIILITGLVFLTLMFLSVLLRLSVEGSTDIFSRAFLNSIILFLLLFIGAFFSYPLRHLKFSFQKRMLGYFSMVSLAIIILFFSFRSSTKRMDESSRWVEHTNEVLLLSSKIQSLLSEVEAGVRDFLLTGKEQYLPVFDKGADSLDRAMLRLRTLTADNPRHQLQIDSLQQQLSAYLDFRKELVIRVKLQQSPLRQIRSEMEAPIGTMLEARRLIRTVQSGEEQLLAQRKTQNQRRIELAKKSFILFLAIAALLLVIAFLVVYYNTKARNKAEADLRNSLNEISNFKTLFECAPGLYLILKPDLSILAASDEYLKATLKRREEIRGRNLFEVFPDNPDNPEANAVSNLRTSLQEVLETKTARAMVNQRYDIIGSDGQFEERTWAPLNKPVLDAEGNVVFIIHSVEDITVRLHNEQELLRKTAEIKDLYNNAPCGYHSLDQDGYFVAVNDTELAWLGYQREDMIGQLRFSDITTAEGQQQFNEQYEVFKERGYIHNIEFDLLRRDGSLLPVMMSATAIYDQNGQYLRSRTTVLDYTERKILDDQLRRFNRELEKRVEAKTKEVIEKERQYRFLLENMREGIQVIGFDWTYLFVNHSVEGQSRFSARELLGHRLTEVYPGIMQTELYRVLNDCMTERKATIFENEFSYANGASGWFELSIQPVPEGLFILSMDITERKRTEALLLASEETKRLIMDAAQDAIICIDTAGRITIWTPQAETVFGWREQEVLGKELAELIVPPQHRLAHRQGMGRYLSTGQGPVINKLIEITAINRAGLEFPVELSIVPFEQKGQTFFCGFIRDITGRKRAEEDLHRYTAELKASNTELERFAYIASHDLQEPLRMVSSFLSLLEEDLEGKLNETQKEYIYFAVDGAERMKSLIQALLQYSRVGSNKEEFTPTDLDESSRYVSMVLEEEIRKNKATLQWDPLPTLPVQKTLINQLFLNLVGNALKYRSARDPLIRVEVREDKENYIFSVTDNGLGIDPRFFEKIFVIFQRLHNKSEYSGTGIGLAICKKIVDLHHGRIWVESEPGKGSSFYFSIPKTRTYETRSQDFAG
jgi:PAS domain S-box-containing protein